MFLHQNIVELDFHLNIANIVIWSVSFLKRCHDQASQSTGPLNRLGLQQHANANSWQCCVKAGKCQCVFLLSKNLTSIACCIKRVSFLVRQLVISSNLSGLPFKTSLNFMKVACATNFITHKACSNCLPLNIDKIALAIIISGRANTRHV